jgi:hypothetical protein
MATWPCPASASGHGHHQARLAAPFAAVGEDEMRVILLERDALLCRPVCLYRLVRARIGDQPFRRHAHQDWQGLRPAGSGLPGQLHHPSGGTPVHDRGADGLGGRSHACPDHRGGAFQRLTDEVVGSSAHDDDRATRRGRLKAHQRDEPGRVLAPAFRQ